VAAEARAQFPAAQIFVQRQRLGTAHAVLAAKPAIEQGADDILVIFGDTPLIRPRTLVRLRTALASGAAVAVVGFRPADPVGYGRLLTQGDALVGVVEHVDASESERAITLCNGGLMACR
jgi:bifunctional UDP-N-acetylglucosamine pyrophosphorylase/glucosamine-1-phosphate N-acetyltransferase